MLKDDALPAQLLEDYTSAELGAADRAMLDYAVKLTNGQQAMSRADVDSLRAAGFDDRAILDVAQITAYFAFATRLANGLGVQLEEKT